MPIKKPKKTNKSHNSNKYLQQILSRKTYYTCLNTHIRLRKLVTPTLVSHYVTNIKIQNYCIFQFDKKNKRQATRHNVRKNHIHTKNKNKFF